MYIATPVTLKDEMDEPDLIPREFRELLGWSAAIRLLRAGDQQSPAEWKSAQRELRLQFWKMAASGSPALYPSARIRNHSPDTQEFF